MTAISQHRRSTPFNGRELTVTWAGATDVGRRRENNQDAFLTAYPLFVVADGMGGHAGGEVASAAVVSELEALVDAGPVTPALIEAALGRATEEIVRHPETTDEGTGTTVTGVFLTELDGGAQWVSLNIGDSRVYQLREGGIAQVTSDHSVVQELIDSGRLSAEEAEGHPYSNVITRAVGASEVTVPDYTALDVRDGDYLVVCSDGLTKELTDYGIAHFIAAHPEPGAAIEAMMTAALENGGRDNITIIVLRFALSGGDDIDSSSTTRDSAQ